MTTPKQAKPLFFLLVGLTLLLLVAHVGIGSYAWYRPWETLVEIFRGPGHQEDANTIIWQVRLPRAVVCLGIGASLGLVGSAFQALLRNPLADPFVMGASSGAAIGGVIASLLGFGLVGMTAGGFVTGIATLGLVFILATRRGVVETQSLLLSGIVIGTLFSSLLSVVLWASGSDASRILNWLVGNLSRTLWEQTYVLGVGLLICFPLLFLTARQLNAYALGETTASRLGVNVRRLRWTILAAGTALTSICVGIAGIIAFVGLAAPHMARTLVGVDWRRSMPASALCGASLLLISDLIAQRGLTMFGYMSVMNLPVGLVTSLLGAPSLLFLLRNSRL